MAAPASLASRVASTLLNQPGRQLKGSKTAVVVSAGLMDRTVKVRLWGSRWENKVSKSFKFPIYHLVHDPNNSVRQGDVITISSGWRASHHKRHIVKHIIAPGAGVPIEERPPVPNEDELLADYTKKREAKLERRAQRDAERREIAMQAKAAKEAKKARMEEWLRTRGKSGAAETSPEDVD